MDIRPPAGVALCTALGPLHGYRGGPTPVTPEAVYRYAINLNEDENIVPAISLLEWLASNEVEPEERGLAILNDIIDLLYHGTQLRRAERMARDTLAGWKRIEGADDPSTLRTATQLALVLIELGRHEEAEEIMRDTVARQIRVRGAEDPTTLRAKTALANSLRAGTVPLGSMGIEEVITGAVTRAARAKLLEAERLYRDVLAVVVPDSDRAMTVRHQLGAVLRHLRKSRRAKRAYEELVADLSRLRGEGDLSTWAARLNLAVVLNDMGKTKKATAAMADVLSARRRLLGPRHHDTLTAQINLAAMYSNQDHDDQAMPLLEDAIEGYMAIYGPYHPKVLGLARTLAFLRGMR